MRSVDTDALVRVLMGDSPTQLARAEAFVERGAWISHLVLAETTWVLKSVYSITPARIAAMIEMLLQHESWAVQDADVVAAALKHFRAKPALGFSDCLILEVARKAGHLPLGTFDRGIGKLDGAEKL